MQLKFLENVPMYNIHCIWAEKPFPNVHRQTSLLQMCTGFHAQTQLHVATITSLEQRTYVHMTPFDFQATIVKDDLYAPTL